MSESRSTALHGDCVNCFNFCNYMINCTQQHSSSTLLSYITQSAERRIPGTNKLIASKPIIQNIKCLAGPLSQQHRVCEICAFFCLSNTNQTITSNAVSNFQGGCRNYRGRAAFQFIRSNYSDTVSTSLLIAFISPNRYHRAFLGYPSKSKNLNFFPFHNSWRLLIMWHGIIGLHLSCNQRANGDRGLLAYQILMQCGSDVP